jgi:hypothetical protein
VHPNLNSSRAVQAKLTVAQSVNEKSWHLWNRKVLTVEAVGMATGYGGVGIRTSVRLRIFSVGFEVFKAVTIKNAVFWDVAQCWFIINRRFGGTRLLHFQGGRNKASEEKCQTVTNRLVAVQWLSPRRQ